MDINTFIQNNPLYSLIISGVFGALLGALGSWFINDHFFKKQIKKALIRYQLSEPLDIGKGLSTTFTDFKIQIGDTTLTDNVKYIKGSFVNVHHFSIQPPLGKKYRTINLTFPNKCEIKGAKITGGSKLSYIRDINVDFAEKNKKNKDNQDTLPKNILSFELPDVFESKGRFDFASIYYDPNNTINEIKVSKNIPDVDIELISENSNDSASFIKRYSIGLISLLVCTIISYFILLDDLIEIMINGEFIVKTLSVIIFIFTIFLFITIYIVKAIIHNSNYGKDNQGKDSEA